MSVGGHASGTAQCARCSDPLDDGGDPSPGAICKWCHSIGALEAERARLPQQTANYGTYTSVSDSRDVWEVLRWVWWVVVLIAALAGKGAC